MMTSPNLIERLIEAGHPVQVVRGIPYLDGCKVATIIDQVPVRFERRRYGNRTFTWAYAFVAGWFSLGDAWPSAIPRHAELSAALEHLRTNNI